MSAFEPLPVRVRKLVCADGTTRVRLVVRCPMDERWTSFEACKRCKECAHASAPSGPPSSATDGVVVCTRNRPRLVGAPLETAWQTSIADAVDATLVCTEPGATTARVAQVLEADDVDVAVVVDAGENPIGILSRRDAEYTEQGACARDVMTPFVITLMENVSIADALTLVVSREIHNLPVLSSGRVMGVLSRRGIVAWFVRASRRRRR